MASEAIRVKGLRDLQRAFALADKGLVSDLRSALQSAAEPVRSDAEQLAQSQISGMRRVRLPWWGMRVGVTKSLVYVAPRQRGVRSKGRRRANLAALLIDESMQPALDRNVGRVEREIDDALDDLARAWGRV